MTLAWESSPRWSGARSCSPSWAPGS
jgi:hypothetical protein